MTMTAMSWPGFMPISTSALQPPSAIASLLKMMAVGGLLVRMTLRRHLVAAGLVDEGGRDQVGIDLDAVPLQRLAVAGQEQIAEIEVERRTDGGDAAVAARDQAVDRLGARLLEIEVERGVGLAAGSAAAERGEGEADLGEIVDALVLAPRPGQHDRVGPARLDDAAQALLLIVARRRPSRRSGRARVRRGSPAARSGTE